MTKLISALAGILSILVAGPTFAATVSSTAPLTPASWAQVNPANSLSVGSGYWIDAPAVRYGNLDSKYRSPFDGSNNGPAVTPLSNWQSIGYFAVGPSNSSYEATLGYAYNQKEFSFLWGSLDTYNQIQFYNSSSASPVFTLLAANVLGSITTYGAAYVTVSNLLFNRVKFYSGTEALEFSNISSVSTVPLPAALPLLAAGLGAFGLLGWRRKSRAQASRLGSGAAGVL